MTGMRQYAVRTLALLTAAALTAGLAAGCNNKKKDGGETAESGMGRYAEQIVSDSEGNVYEAYYDDEEGFVYYIQETGQDERQMITRHTLKGDGTVETENVEALTALYDQGSFIRDISHGPNGVLYVLYTGANSSDSKLGRITEGGVFEEIPMEGWSMANSGLMSTVGMAPVGGTSVRTGQNAPGITVGDPNAGGPQGNDPGAGTETGTETGQPDQEEGPEALSTLGAPQPIGVSGSGVSNSNGTFSFNGSTMLYPSGVIALEDGFIIVYALGGVNQYDANGTLVREYLGGGMTGAACVYEGAIAVKNTDNAEIVLYDLTTGKKIKSVALENEGNGFSATGGMITLGGDQIIGLDAEGLYYGDSSGIYREKGGVFTQVVDGRLASLVMPDLSMATLTSAGNDYYAFLANMGSSALARYSYDENIPSLPDITLEVFSLYDNSTIRQAIGAFQRKNPNVLVNLTVAMESGSGATLEDVVRALNTEILNGKGPDIIVLDGLPIDSYIEKGVLADITALVNEITSREGLYESMMRTYARDGAIYGAPSRFTVPVMLGRVDLLADINSVSDLARMTVELQSGAPAFLRVPDDLWSKGALMEYYEAGVDGFINDDGSIDKDGLAAYFADVLAIDDTLKANAPELESGMYMIAAMSRGGGGMEVINMGSYDIQNGKALVHLQTLNGVLGLFTIANNFVDMEDMGIASVFNGSRYNPKGGVGISSVSKEKALAEDFIRLLLSSEIQDKYLYDGFPVSEGSLTVMLDEMMETYDGEMLGDMGFAEMCRNLSDPVFVNEVIKSAAEKQAAELLAGRVTPEEAAAKVIESTWLYLAE